MQRSAKFSKSLVTSFMFLTRSKILFCLALALTTSSVAFGQASGPKSTAADFYKFDRSNSQIFTRRNIDARKRWFSDALYKLLIDALAREEAYLSKNPTDKGYFGDGLPFQPLGEVCELNGTKYRRAVSYGKETVKGVVGDVDVYFKYPKGCHLPDILLAVSMEKQRGRWVINDMRFLGDKTSLVDDLNRIEY